MKRILMFACALLLSYLAAAQGYICDGVVVDENGTPLPGVEVVDVNTASFTVTDGDGAFSIEVRDRNSVLRFSFLGMVEQTVPASEAAMIVMKADVMALDDVVVTAYGSTKRTAYTGSATVVSDKKMEEMKVTSVSQLLQGASSGVQVISGSGQPGEDAEIRIRGISSINGVSSPLYVVDGVPYGAYINAINPRDIESISVLKDAAATALYGSRAANGVIMITTKKGSGGAPRFTLDVNTGFSQLAVGLPEMVDPMQYHLLAWEAVRNGYLESGETEYAAANMATANLGSYLRVQAFNVPNPVGPDGKFVEGAEYLWLGNSWEDALFSSKLRTEVNASVSGSTDNSSYYLSFGYLDDNGALTVSSFERMTGRVNVSTTVAKILDVGMNLSYSHSMQDYPDQSRAIRFINEVPDIYPVYEWDYDAGSWRTDGAGDRILDYGSYRPSNAWPDANPLGESVYDQRYYEQNNITGRVNASLNLPYGFKISSNFGVDYSVGSGYVYYNNLYGWSESVRGRSVRDRNQFMTWTLNVLASWDKYYDRHHINVLAGHESYADKRQYLSGSREGFPISGMYELSGASVLLDASSSEDNLRMEAWIAKLEYDWDERYYLAANYRRDGSSRFAASRRWGDFWSVSASWRLSNEDFMKDVGWVDNLKIRASYGTQGNDNIGTYYAWQGVYASGWNDIAHSGYLVGSLPTPDLTWEKNAQLNIGVDAGLFNRLELSVDYFRRVTRDLLFWRDLPPSSGIGSVRDNIGDVLNSGVEVQLNTVNILTKNFRWESDLNISAVRNEILDLPTEEEVNGLFKWEKGKTIYDFYIAEWAGVDPETGSGLFWKDVVETGPDGEETVVGRVKVEDNSAATRYYQGSALPYLYGGFTNRFYFKGFELSVFLYFSLGGLVYDYTEAARMHAGNIGLNWDSAMLDRWTPDNPDASIPRLTTASNTWNSVSTRFLHDASYMRLKNLTFSYSFPQKWMERIKLDGLKLYFSADNLFTVAAHSADPEAGGVSGLIDNTLYPMRTFSFGLNFSF